MPQLLIIPLLSPKGQQTALQRLYDTNNILSRLIFFASLFLLRDGRRKSGGLSLDLTSRESVKEDEPHSHSCQLGNVISVVSQIGGEKISQMQDN